MKLILVKSGVVRNHIMPPSDDQKADYEAYLRTKYDFVVEVDDSVKVETGYIYDGTNFNPPPVVVVPLAENIMASMYKKMADRMVALAPFFGVAEALIQAGNWAGLKLYFTGLRQSNDLTDSDVSRLSAIMISNGVDLSKF